MATSGLRGGQLFINEDNIVFWGDRHVLHSGLYDNNTESFINDATVSFALKDAASAAVSGATGTCSYVTGSQGVYEGVLEDGVTLTENATYYLEITATASGDRVGFRRLQYTATYHGAS